MIKNVVCLFLLLSIVTCQNDTYAISVQNTIITGVINNPSSAVINIIEEDIITGRKIYSEVVKDDGSFKLIFPLDIAKDIYLDYNNQLVTLYLHPDDSIHITATGKAFEKSMSFTGDQAIANQILKTFWRGFEELMNKNAFWTNKSNNNPDEYSAFMKRFKIQCDSLIASKDAPADIISWMYTYINYRILEELFEYSEKKKNPYHHKLYNLIDEYASFNAIYKMNSTQYYETALIPLLRKFQINGTYQQLLKQNNEGNYGPILNATLKNLQSDSELGTCAAILMSQALDRDYKSAESFFYKILPYISNEVIKEKLIIKKYKMQNWGHANKERIKTVDDLANEAIVGNIFSELAEFKGNVLYIDIWGTFCKPCLKQFPSSVKLF
ncbi:MAG: hypothetical protein WD555_02840 [Fulvivirga sp.]